ncbi:MAG: hypothetical protein ABXS93_06335 [Sulfurimonas sp.]
MKMRRGSAALVPLLIAIMILFWMIAFMGGANDNFHVVNKVTNLQNLQEKLLISSVRYRYMIAEEAKEQGITLSDEELDQKVDQYIQHIMEENNIEKK